MLDITAKLSPSRGCIPPLPQGWALWKWGRYHVLTREDGSEKTILDRQTIPDSLSGYGYTELAAQWQARVDAKELPKYLLTA